MGIFLKFFLLNVRSKDNDSEIKINLPTGYGYKYG